MGNPKKRTSKSKKNMRRANDHVAVPNVIYCECGEATLSHRACSKCGTYRGKKVTGSENA